MDGPPPERPKSSLVRASMTTQSVFEPPPSTPTRTCRGGCCARAMLLLMKHLSCHGLFNARSSETSEGQIFTAHDRHWASAQLYNGMASRPRSQAFQTVPGNLVVSASTNSQKDAASSLSLEDDAEGNTDEGHLMYILPGCTVKRPKFPSGQVCPPCPLSPWQVGIPSKCHCLDATGGRERLRVQKCDEQQEI